MSRMHSLFWTKYLLYISILCKWKFLSDADQSLISSAMLTRIRFLSKQLPPMLQLTGIFRTAPEIKSQRELSLANTIFSRLCLRLWLWFPGLAWLCWLWNSGVVRNIPVSCSMGGSCLLTNRILVQLAPSRTNCLQSAIAGADWALSCPAPTIPLCLTLTEQFYTVRPFTK